MCVCTLNCQIYLNHLRTTNEPLDRYLTLDPRTDPGPQVELESMATNRECADTASYTDPDGTTDPLDVPAEENESFWPWDPGHALWGQRSLDSPSVLLRCSWHLKDVATLGHVYLHYAPVAYFLWKSTYYGMHRKLNMAFLLHRSGAFLYISYFLTVRYMIMEYGSRQTAVLKTTQAIIHLYSTNNSFITVISVYSMHTYLINQPVMLVRFLFHPSDSEKSLQRHSTF